MCYIILFILKEKLYIILAFFFSCWKMLLAKVSHPEPSVVRLRLSKLSHALVFLVCLPSQSTLRFEPHYSSKSQPDCWNILIL